MVGQAVREGAEVASVGRQPQWANPELGRKRRGERENGWERACGVGSGGASETDVSTFTFYTYRFAVNYSLVVI
jgi:hypothetical protein